MTTLLSLYYYCILCSPIIIPYFCSVALAISTFSTVISVWSSITVGVHLKECEQLFLTGWIFWSYKCHLFFRYHVSIHAVRINLIALDLCLASPQFSVRFLPWCSILLVLACTSQAIHPRDESRPVAKQIGTGLVASICTPHYKFPCLVKGAATAPATGGSASADPYSVPMFAQQGSAGIFWQITHYKHSGL